jgi:glycosyltransferase involved in cell wall biosynthesis
MPWIGWIPDFQHKRLPDFFSEKERQHRDEQFQRLIDEASHIVVSSWDAYEDLMRWFPINSDRVSVLPFTSVATPRWYQQEPNQVVERFGLPAKYLMFPSQFWIHKNHRLLFEALGILRDRGMPDASLVLTGQTFDYRWPEYFADLQNSIDQQNLNKQVHILGLIDRQEQIQLLRCAAAVIQPSLFEGWSSLVEDCKTLGKRIYLSDLRVHREQNPQDSEYFDPFRAEELAELLARDWSTLEPGPDYRREKQAHAQHTDRATAFAESFLHVTQRASGY